jgi:hypothetical protein
VKGIEQEMNLGFMNWGVRGATRSSGYRQAEDTTSVASVSFPHFSRQTYNLFMERKIFWTVFTVLGLLADFLLPIWWGLAATIPIVFIAWWVAYRSDWF